MRLKGKTSVISGGSRRTGLAIALRAAADGANTTIAKSGWGLRLFRLLSALFAAAFSTNAAFAEIGYFSPSGVRSGFAWSVGMATINASGSPGEVAESFRIAAESGLKVNLDLSPLIAVSRPVDNVKTSYIGRSAPSRKKSFAPRSDNKLRDFLPDDEIRKLLINYLQPIAPYKRALYSVFLIDEPYLNGVPRAELERVGALTREVFAEQGFGDIKLGVLFAGAMFNSRFAERTQIAALGYAERIDRHREKEARRIAKLPQDQRPAAEKELQDWTTVITNFRLTTYDSAGNLYTDGGIPEGFDIVAFDLYLSTLLFDTLYEDALSWLAVNTQTLECDGFEAAKASAIRAELSFFQDGPVIEGDRLRGRDDEHLDRLYGCRVGGVLELLNEQLKAQAMEAEVMVVTESSANGVLEFTSSGQVEQDQPEALVRKRVTDEVRRALDFLPSRADHILFFTFDDEFDNTINLPVGGVSSIPEAMELINGAAERD